MTLDQMTKSYIHKILKPRGQMLSYRHQKGFTLIEVLVTIAILSIILSSIYGILSATIKAREIAEETSALYESGAGLIEIMASDLEGLYLYGLEELFFAGENDIIGAADADALHFVTGTPRYLEAEVGPTGPVVADYYLEQNEVFASRLNLYRREVPYREAKARESKKGILLSRDIKSLNFLYFDGEEWLEEWNTESVPQAIRIDIALWTSKRAADTFSFERKFSATILPIADTLKAESGEKTPKITLESTRP